MATRGKTKQRRYVTVIGEPKIGPETHGIRYCMMCMTPITDGEHWQKVRRGRGGIAVGVHDRCRVREVQAVARTALGYNVSRIEGPFRFVGLTEDGIPRLERVTP